MLQRAALTAFAVLFLGFIPRGFTQTITGFQPAEGPVGTLLTLTGSNLMALTSVTVGGTAAVIVNKESTKAQVLVMPGTVGGSVVGLGVGVSSPAPGLFAMTGTPLPVNQQGDKLLAEVSDSNSLVGYSTAISADGNTFIVGGPLVNDQVGAAWIFVREGGSWRQQGPKLVGSDFVGAPLQGYSVALSADGTTAIVGGWADDNEVGAAWVFTRTGTTWAQQGPKLVGTGSAGGARQGHSVALSADGSTAVVGGVFDNNVTGAVWVFVRTDTTWTQQGEKLVGTGNVGSSQQGISVALSADGNTTIVGGWSDDNELGAAWVFVRTGGTWSQQGTKLVGTGSVGSRVYQGKSVALSADGNTALIGAHHDDSATGAAWVFTRMGTTWSQQGEKLVGTGAAGPFPGQGYSVALTADGTTALLGGSSENDGQGGVWAFTRSGSTWSQNGTKISGAGSSTGSYFGASLAISADGTTAVVGGVGDANNRGAAWVFVAPINGSGEQPSRYINWFRLGPNPTEGRLWVYVSAREPFFGRLEVVAMNGQVIRGTDANFLPGAMVSLELNLGDLSKGVYVIRFSHRTSGETLVAQRIVLK